MMRLGVAALALSTTGCVRSVWFTQPLRETYEIGVVSSPMGGDALAAKGDVEDPTEDEDAAASEGDEAPAEGEAEEASPPAEIAPAQQPARSPDQLQYFVSERLVLQREANSRDGAISQGHIKVRRGRFIEQVVVRRKTPGVAVDWGDDWVAVSFEADSALVFGLDDTHGSPSSNIYHLQTRRGTDGGPVMVNMRGQQYEVRSGHNARLMVRRDTHTKRARRRRIMKGRTLEDAAQ